MKVEWPKGKKKEPLYYRLKSQVQYFEQIEEPKHQRLLDYLEQLSQGKSVDDLSLESFRILSIKNHMLFGKVSGKVAGVRISNLPKETQMEVSFISEERADGSKAVVMKMEWPKGKKKEPLYYRLKSEANYFDLIEEPFHVG